MVVLRGFVTIPAVLASLAAAGALPAPAPEITAAPAAPRLEKRDYRTLYGEDYFVGYFTSDAYASTWNAYTCGSGGVYTTTYTSGYTWAACSSSDYVDFVTSCVGDYAYWFYSSTYGATTYTGYDSVSCSYTCVYDHIMTSSIGETTYWAGCAETFRGYYTVFQEPYASLPALANAAPTSTTNGFTTTSSGLSTTRTPTSTTTSTITPTPTPSPKPIKPKKKPIGPIVGGVVGGLAAIGAAILAVFVARRKKRATPNDAAAGQYAQPVLAGGGAPGGAPPGQPIGVAAGGYYPPPEKTAAATTSPSPMSPVQSPPPVYAAPHNGGWGNTNTQPQYAVASPPDGIYEVGGGQPQQQAHPVQGGWGPPQPVGSPVPQPRAQAHEMGS